MHHPGMSCRGSVDACPSSVMPRFKRGIQYSRGASREHDYLRTLDRPVKPGDDTELLCALQRSQVAPNVNLTSR